MDDRITPGLYLEMVDDSPDQYTSGRLVEVLACAGVARATWWENVHPFRTDLPRRLPERSLLAVYEVDDEFVPPPAPEETTALHFRHYRRPGQGSLSGRPTVGLSLVLIGPKQPEHAQDLRDWADFVHIRHIADAAVPGYTMITPYERVGDAEPRFMHFYEMDTDDPETAFKSMTPLVIDRIGEPGTGAFDEWARHPALCIWYVNSFRRLGERSPS